MPYGFDELTYLDLTSGEVLKAGTGLKAIYLFQVSMVLWSWPYLLKSWPIHFSELQVACIIVSYDPSYYAIELVPMMNQLVNWQSNVTCAYSILLNLKVVMQNGDDSFIHVFIPNHHANDRLLGPINIEVNKFWFLPRRVSKFNWRDRKKIIVQSLSPKAPLLWPMREGEWICISLLNFL